MLKSKKIISIIIGVTAVMSMITLSACNTPTGSANSGSQTSKAVSKGSVKMKVINFRVEDQKFYNEFNQSFMDKYPEVEVGYDAVPTASYVSLVSARMAANEVDVLGVMFGMELNQEYANFMVDLKGQAGLNGIGADYLKYTSKQGVQVSAPLNIIGIVVYYNKKIFADNNLNVPKTWSEFLNVCEKLKTAKIDPIMYGGKDQWPINVVMDAVEAPIVRSANPQFYDQIRTGKTNFSDPLWTEAWQKLQKVTTYFQENSAGLSYSRAQGLFAQGKAGMMIDGTWSLAQIQEAKPTFEYGSFVLPTNEKAENNMQLPFKIGGGIAAINNDKKEYSLKYINFHLQDDNYQKYVDTTLLGSIKTNITTNLPIYKDFYESTTKRAMLCENLIVLGMPWNTTDYGNRILIGKMTAEEAASRFAGDIEKTKSEWSKYIDITH